MENLELNENPNAQCVLCQWRKYVCWCMSPLCSWNDKLDSNSRSMIVVEKVLKNINNCSDIKNVLWVKMKCVQLRYFIAFPAGEDNISIDVCLHYVLRMTSLTLIPNLPIIEDIALKNTSNGSDIKESFEQKCFLGKDRKCWIEYLSQQSFYFLLENETVKQFLVFALLFQ